MADFFGETWEALLHFNQLDGFDKLWELEAEWFEEPNRRRGGWSGVSRIELQRPEGGKVGLFLKRQENHNCSSLLHPVSGILTFVHEFKKIRDFQRYHIPAQEPVFFGKKTVEGKHRAVLITRELEGFSPLSDPLYGPHSAVLDSRLKRKILFSRLAEIMHKMHDRHIQHGSFYLKHIFAKQLENGQWDIRLIDLEKARWLPLKSKAIRQDLYSLNRYSNNWSLTDRMRFLLIYTQEKRLSPHSKAIWRYIAHRTRRKLSRKEK